MAERNTQTRKKKKNVEGAQVLLGRGKLDDDDQVGLGPERFQNTQKLATVLSKLVVGLEPGEGFRRVKPFMCWGQVALPVPTMLPVETYLRIIGRNGAHVAGLWTEFSAVYAMLPFVRRSPHRIMTPCSQH